MLLADSVQQPANQPLHPVAIEHSDAYQTRAKIHKYASFATLPLFGAELAWDSRCSTHQPTPEENGRLMPRWAQASSDLFAVNTVTGAWNLFGEGRQDKEGRTLRLVHGLLMMAADARLSRDVGLRAAQRTTAARRSRSRATR